MTQAEGACSSLRRICGAKDTCNVVSLGDCQAGSSLWTSWRYRAWPASDSSSEADDFSGNNGVGDSDERPVPFSLD